MNYCSFNHEEIKGPGIPFPNLYWLLIYAVLSDVQIYLKATDKLLQEQNIVT